LAVLNNIIIKVDNRTRNKVYLAPLDAG